MAGSSGQFVTVRVQGYTETARALAAVNAKSKRTLYRGLREAAKPISDDTRSRLSGITDISLSTINPSATVKGVSIRQRARRTSGLRPDFGGLQMRKGFIPAAEAADTELVDRVEAAYTGLIATEGLL